MKKTQTAHLVLLPIVFFLSVPALFISQNIQDIANLRFATFLTLATFAILAIFILLTANSLFKNTPLRVIFTHFTEFILFFIVVTGFVLPVSTSVGMLDPSEIPIDFNNLIIALILAATLTFVSHSKYRNNLYVGVFIFILLNSIVSGSIILFKGQFDESQKSQPANWSLREASNSRNIFVFSLDGISGSAVGEILTDNSQLSESFNGFTRFSHATSSSPATSASTAASLYGNRDFKKLYSTETELWDSDPNNLLTNFLDRNGYQVSTFGAYGINLTKNEMAHDSIYTSSIGVPKLLNFTIARTITSLYVLPERASSWIEQKLQFQGFVSSTHELQDKLENSYAPAWKKGLAITILDANDYIELLEVNQTLPVAHFLHFTFTHYPVEFDRDCVYRGDDDLWFKAMQNRSGVLEETYCAVKVFASFIQRLKTLKILDKSLVILKSDHGKPVNYYDQGDFFAKEIRGHSMWGYGRYEPFLAIKGWGDRQELILNENASPVLLDDIAKTICDQAINSQMCEIFPGYNLLANPINIPDSAKATIFVVASENSSFKYDTHISVTIKRSPDIIQNLHGALTSKNE